MDGSRGLLDAYLMYGVKLWPAFQPVPCDGRWHRLLLTGPLAPTWSEAAGRVFHVPFWPHRWLLPMAVTLQATYQQPAPAPDARLLLDLDPYRLWLNTSGDT